MPPKGRVVAGQVDDTLFGNPNEHALRKVRTRPVELRSVGVVGAQELQGMATRAWAGPQDRRSMGSGGEERQRLKALSDARKAKWPNTLEALRAKKERARQEKAAADAPDAPPADTWSAASASRRSNPYLQQSTEEQYKTFKEQIEPRRVVNSLLSICNQLQGEWESDLLAIAREGGYILRVSAAAEAGEEEAFERAFGGAGGGGAGGDGDAAAAECAVGGDDDVASSSLCVDPAAILDAAAPLPAAITQAFRTQSSAWILDGVQEAPSPYRETWWDLLERATTREAARAAAAALERRGGAGDAVAAEWLRQKLAEWEPRFDAPPRAHLASIFLAEVCLAPAGPIARADGSLALAEPARVADELIVQRERVAKAWAAALAETGPGRASLLAADLEGQLNAPDAPS